ncbi:MULTISPECIES: hypothetical protein [Haloferax]|uniref:Uncharacterized protein n=2 Tax=Haloferax TaxID=2251 RepID=A0A6G1Z3X8_9EURY|nr:MULTISPECIES: hypothetical protein [Haloferax]KAB1188325.1 hypothetical protein Hfx1149_09920 [Haloferax sp. CBA1149]MRW81014.1 hypothetical protein [Haloferax marinisediminis]
MRETYLVECDFDAANTAATRATEYMSNAFKIDFPDADPNRAERAGELFMRALFLQDEIENRAAFYDCLSRPVPEGTFVDAAEAVPDLSINDDPRWRDVRILLESVCEEIDISTEYAVLHARFWRLHGQRRDGWRSIARRAHRIKLARMIPSATAADIENLAEYFVAGVEQHDDWHRNSPERDISSTVDIVARYYQRVFDLRGH